MADPDPALIALQERVAAGTVWLAEHDPGSRFHLWFEAGLTPLSPMPNEQAAAARPAWREYYAARQTFERLDRELAKLEHRKPTMIGDVQWSPPKEVRGR